MAAHSNTTLFFTAAAAGAAGLIAGIILGRGSQTDAGQIPCPPCRIVQSTVTGENAIRRQECRLVGRIDSGWTGGTVSIAGPLAPTLPGDPTTFEADDCINHVVTCPGTGVPLRFQKMAALTSPALDNPLCTGTGCTDGCSPP